VGRDVTSGAWRLRGRQKRRPGNRGRERRRLADGTLQLVQKGAAHREAVYTRR